MMTAWPRGSIQAVAILLLGLSAVPLAAQPPQTTVTVPYQGVGDSFFERTGMSWGARGRGWNLSFGSPGGVLPPFGPYAPGAGLRGGVALGRPGGSGGFQMNFAAEQGSRRTMTTQAPSLTLSNGVPGWLFVGQARPFVVGYVPIVGGFPVLPTIAPSDGPGDASRYTPAAAVLERYHQLLSEEGPPASGHRVSPAAVDPAAPAARGQPPAQQGSRPPARSGMGTEPVTADSLARRLAGKSAHPSGLGGQGEPASPAVAKIAADSSASESAQRLAAAAASSAGQPAVSVTRAKQLHEQEQAARRREAEDFFRRAVEAEAAGKIGTARVYYQMVTQRADGELKSRALARHKALGAASKPSR